MSSATPLLVQMKGDEGKSAMFSLSNFCACAARIPDSDRDSRPAAGLHITNILLFLLAYDHFARTMNGLR